MKKKCVICGKEFEVYDTRPRADCPHKRGRHTVTCSKKCSRELPIDEMNLEEVEDELGKVYGEVVEGRNKLLYDRWKELKPKPCCENCGTEETSVMNVFGGHWCKECWNLFEEERKKKTEKRYKKGGSSRTTIK